MHPGLSSSYIWSVISAHEIGHGIFNVGDSPLSCPGPAIEKTIMLGKCYSQDVKQLNAGEIILARWAPSIE